MISIIICSIEPSMLSDVTKNIDNTIGVPYEIISFDNRNVSLGICEVYNQCAGKAKYRNLLFLHEDVKFYTQNWGITLVNLLSDKEIGLVGMAGAVFKASAPTSWVSVPREYYRSNQYFSEEECLRAVENSQDGFMEVAIVDGSFLAMNVKTWSNFLFSKDLHGFHLYDMDISYKIFKTGLKIVVPNNIVLQHFSRGSFNFGWQKASIAWHKGKVLPLFLPFLGSREVAKLEKDGDGKYLAELIKNGFFPKSWFLIWRQLCLRHRRLYPGLFFRIIVGYYKKYFLIKLYPYKKKILNALFKSYIKNSDFAIISNNCWGGGFYQALGLPYNTPFIGLYINIPCYIKMLGNMDHYLQQELVFINKSKYPIKELNYPIGLLDDIEIHFLHYKSETEAKSKWDKRKKRLLNFKGRILYKIDDRDFAEDRHIESFHELIKENGISFTKKKLDNPANFKLDNINDMILIHTTFHLFDAPLFINSGRTEVMPLKGIFRSLIKYPETWEN